MGVFTLEVGVHANVHLLYVPVQIQSFKTIQQSCLEQTEEPAGCMCCRRVQREQQPVTVKYLNPVNHS